ncbi:hypothetical protein GCM10009664_09140 [Kitasatospora gansuensis]
MHKVSYCSADVASGMSLFPSALAEIQADSLGSVGRDGLGTQGVETRRAADPISKTNPASLHQIRNATRSSPM